MPDGDDQESDEQYSEQAGDEEADPDEGRWRSLSFEKRAPDWARQCLEQSWIAISEGLGEQL
jgi:hypothetical protein